MNRRDLLKRVGAIGLGSMLPFGRALNAGEKAEFLQSACVLTPQETEGPFYFNPILLRQDITVNTPTGVAKTGLPLNMIFTVVNTNCDPIRNVLADIWHNDKDGIYSGYAGQPGGVNTMGQNFLRGIQMTGADGKCTFKTIYPGWYPGRVTHIHFKVRLTSTTYVTSQFCFSDSINTAVYQTPMYVAKGQNSLTNATDNIFRSANPAGQIITLTSNAATGGYEGSYTIVVNAPTGVNEPEVGPEGFALLQNYPNPFSARGTFGNPTTTIAYRLPVSSAVKLTVFDVHGSEVATLMDKQQAAGTHEIIFDASKLSSGFYYYKLSAGNFAATKEMLLIK